jgi:signal transduction histidine kinase
VAAAVTTIRAWLEAHPLLVDLGIALVVLGASLPPLIDARSCGCAPSPTWAFAVVAVQCAALVARRRYPFTVSLLVGILTGVYGAATLPDPAVPFAGLVAVYSAAAHASRRAALVTAAATTVGIGTALLLDSGHATAQDWSLNYLVFATAWLLGDAARNRREATAHLEQRAESLERTRAAEASRATVEERNRIAREMHDVVAHAVSLMVVQAEAGPVVLPHDPDRATAAFDAISATGKEALAQMRRLLGVLRDDDRHELAPQPGAADIGGLVASMREAGLEVDFATSGTARPLAPAVDLSTFRIVQEALTNVVKHAGPARAAVRLRYRPDALQVEVTDQGLGGPPIPPPGGNGLIGMRERVAMVGGALSAGPGPNGGWSVRATLPFGGGAGTGAGGDR